MLPDSVRPLVELLSDGSPDVRSSAVRAFREAAIADPAIAGALAELAPEIVSPDGRRAAVDVLQIQTGEPAVRAALGQIALNDEDSNVRTAAIRALGDHLIDSSLHDTIEALADDADETVRVAISMSLRAGDTHRLTPAAIEVLEHLMADSLPAVRQHAADSRYEHIRAEIAATEIGGLEGRSEQAERDETACPVVKKVHRAGNVAADPIHGLFAATIEGEPRVVEYEPDSELHDIEQVPLLEDGGIEAFIRREVLPYAADAWFDESSIKIGYEISFTRYFYKPQPLRTLEEIRADILALEQETEGLLTEIVGEAVR